MIQIIIGLLCGIGVYLILADLRKVPYIKTSLASLSYHNAEEKKRPSVRAILNKFREEIKKSDKVVQRNEKVSNIIKNMIER